MGYDSDHPMAEGEVGRVGVAIDTVDDLATSSAAIPLDKVTTSMTINATAAILLAMYVVVGEEQGVARGSSRHGAERRAQGVHRAGHLHLSRPSRRCGWCRVFRFVADEEMNFNPISISGYHMREAGATAVQEVAFTLANAIEYVTRAVAAGFAAGRFGPRLSFFFAGPQRPVRGGGQVPCCAPALGHADARAVRGRRRRPAGSGSTPRPAA